MELSWLFWPLLLLGWTTGTLVTVRVLKSGGMRLDRPDSPARIGSFFAVALTLPASLPAALLWRTAQKLNLPLSPALQYKSQPQFVASWATAQPWELVDGDPALDQEPVGTLLLHYQHKHETHELTIHKHIKGYVFSLRYDARHRLPLALASLPQTPLHPLLPAWHTALHDVQEPHASIPRSGYAKRHQFYGDLVGYYGLIGLKGREYDEWHHSSMVQNWRTADHRQGAEPPVNYDYIAINRGFVLLQHATQSLSRDFEDAHAFIQRLIKELRPLCDLHEPKLVTFALEQHLIAHERGRLSDPTYAKDNAPHPAVFLETCLQRLEHKEPESHYHDALRKLSRTDFPGVAELLGPHIDKARMTHECVRFAKSIANKTNERSQVLLCLRHTMPLNQLRPVLLSIYKDQRNHKSVHEQALAVWSEYYTAKDLPTLRKQAKEANPPELIVTLKAIGNHGSSEDEPILLAQLTHESAPVRIAVLEALGTCGSSGLLHTLREYSQSSARDERKAALGAVQAIQARSPHLEGGGLSLTTQEDADGQLSLAEVQEEGQLSLEEEKN